MKTKRIKEPVIEPKKHWQPVNDPVEAAALKAGGKWKVGVPLWRNVDGVIWAECVDFKLWREARANTGNRNRA